MFIFSAKPFDPNQPNEMILRGKNQFTHLFCFFLLLFLLASMTLKSQLFVAPNGSDQTGNGSFGSPWATITHALDNAMDGSLILVRPGTYTGRIRMRGTFSNGVVVRSEVPYQARLRNNDRVLTFYQDNAGCEGITLEGFDVAHSGPNSSALVVHIDGGGNGAVSRITLRNNVLHDSYNNDILKINNACRDISVFGNMFYNQTGSDEHIDGNSVENLNITGNIFMNDFAASGRVDGSNTSSFIIIKDSNDSTDIYLGTRDVKIDRNVFVNWQGSSGHGFIGIGEDGEPYFEAYDVLVENNLLLGNGSSQMRASFQIRGCRDIVIRNNTVVGDLPANAYAMRVRQEGANLVNNNIFFYNNIWADPSGTMGANATGTTSNDFSDTPIGHTNNYVLSHNLVWNGGQSIPTDANETINYTDDSNVLTSDPGLPAQSGALNIHWDETANTFANGDSSINQVFTNIVTNYGMPVSGSPVEGNALAQEAPLIDILGQPRPANPSIGAFEPLALSRETETTVQTVLEVRPNPVQDFFSWELSSGEKVYRMQILTINGVVVAELFEPQGNVVTSELSAGIYLLRVVTAQGSYVTRFRKI